MEDGRNALGAKNCANFGTGARSFYVIMFMKEGVSQLKKHFKLFSTLFSMLTVMVFSMASVLASPSDGLDWQDSTITATGTARPGQARSMARRAAQLDAYRQLAEITKGVSVDAETTVENFMTTSDVIKTKVNALLKGARIISERPTPDGGYEVTMQMSMFGASDSLASAVMPRNEPKEAFPEPVQSVAPSLPSYDSSASVSVRIDVTASATATAATNNNAIGGYTGLIVDCRGLGLQPTMGPVLKNANGEKIYGHKNLDIDYVIAHGMVGYAKDTNGASRAGSNPLVVKAISLESHGYEPVISVADANRVLIENKASGFLEKASVVFLR